MAKYNTPTKQVIFSHDYGKTFKAINFTKKTVIVQNIVMEPTNNAHQFFIVAASKSKKAEKGYLVHLDFNELHTRVC